MSNGTRFPALAGCALRVSARMTGSPPRQGAEQLMAKDALAAHARDELHITAPLRRGRFMLR
jgi:hypothetical protein